MVRVAMDGQSLYSTSNVRNTGNEAPKVQVPSKSIALTGAQVAQNIEQSMAELKADSQQLEKMSEMVTGRKLQFSVNKELNDVIVTVVDPHTNQVVKQIPSEDMQKLKLRIRKAIGNMFNEVV